MTTGQLDALVGFLISAAVGGAIAYIGYLIDKLEDAWHDRHFHRRK